MFDPGYEGADVGMDGTDDNRSSDKRQYTLKGVETDTIRLMRVAASKEGMKIGSWVSLRMREAAEKALAGKLYVHNVAYEQVGDISADVGVLNNILNLLMEEREATDNRFRLVEKELHEITSGQRTILSALIAKKNA